MGQFLNTILAWQNKDTLKPCTDNTLVLKYMANASKHFFATNSSKCFHFASFPAPLSFTSTLLPLDVATHVKGQANFDCTHAYETPLALVTNSDDLELVYQLQQAAEGSRCNVENLYYLFLHLDLVKVQHLHREMEHIICGTTLYLFSNPYRKCKLFYKHICIHGFVDASLGTGTIR